LFAQTSRVACRSWFRNETVSPRVQEKFDVDLTLREVTLWNAIRKGMSVAQMHPEKVILAADTLVALDNRSSVNRRICTKLQKYCVA
jgi:predicted house-cleaning NTP pyrophosphatase (Maf/HAM1 superfamily)